MFRGRAVRKMVYVKEWWDAKQGDDGNNKKRKARIAAAERLCYAIMFVYEIRKVRCDVMMKNDLPVRKRILIEEVA